MTGREGLADAIYAGGDEPEWLTTVDGSPNAASFEHADRALAHIAAVLHDDATVEAVIGVAVENHRLSRNESEYLTTAVLAVLAERLGVPHVDH